MHGGSRRTFLGAGFVLAAGLAGCKKETQQFSCSDTLDEPDIAARSRVDYIERSPDPARTCDACHQWLAPSSGRCGRCKLFPGPVHPKGTCRLFAPRS